MALNPNQPIVTKVLSNGKREAKYIPNESVTCQYYRDVKVGDLVPDGHVITQKDIDDGIYRKVGFNCASPDVDWMRDTIKNPNLYPFNPLEEFDFESDDEGNIVFGDPGDGGGGSAIGDCAESCFTQGESACYECVGGGGGSTPTPTYNVVNKCCQAGTAHGLSPVPVGTSFIEDGEYQGNSAEWGTYDACNMIDCGHEGNGDSAYQDGETLYWHQESKCEYRLGQFGEGVHNIVWNHYNKIVNLAQAGNSGGDALKHYPYWNNGFGQSGKMYYHPEDLNHGADIDETPNPTTMEYWNLYDNERVDKRQIGVNRAGEELYNFPKYIYTTCEDRAAAGAQGTVGATRGPYVTYNSMHGTEVSLDGIRTCPGLDDITAEFYNSPVLLEYLAQFLGGLESDRIRGFTGNSVFDAPSYDFGYGMTYLSDSDIETIKNGSMPIILFSASQTARDILFRMGAPLPPLVLGYDSPNGYPGHLNECTFQQVDSKYQSLIDEFKSFLEIGTFFSDFGIPNVEIEPTMLGELNVYSARDLRKEKLNACDYIEFMTLPGGDSDGDGIYYRTFELDTENSYLLNFDCNTEFNQDISGYSRMRAVCKDGSSVLIASTGNNNFSTLNHDNTDKIFNTGRDACNSKLKPHSNQDLYYLSDGDLRESLGIYFFESENTEQSTNNFLGNIVDDDFEQIPFPNLLLNGDGRLVNSEFQWNSDEFNSDENVFDGKPYIAENWMPIMQWHSQQTGQGDTEGRDDDILRPLEHRIKTDDLDNEYKNFQYAGMIPYWSSNNTECFSVRKCLIIDTMNPSTWDGTGDNNQDLQQSQWDIRQAMQTWIPIENVDEDSRRENTQYKISFLMKTVDLADGVDLKNTGIHVNAVFGVDELDWSPYYSGGGTDVEYPANFPRNFSLEASGYGATDENQKWPIVPFSNSQCSKNSHPDNHFNIDYNESNNLPEDEFCKKSKASFTNTELNKWEKMEFTFTPRYGDNFSNDFPNWISSLMGSGNKGLKLLFMPLVLSKEFIQHLSRDVTNLPSLGTGDTPYAGGGAFPSPGVTTSEYSQTTLNNINISENGAKIYLDNFEFKEDFSFHPDVDVRKNKGLNQYGDVKLTEYSESDDVQAPLEAQFYFYPRYSYDDILSKDRLVLVEKFKFGQFFISDIDWGDDSPIEYVNEPFQLGVDKMLYHTYEDNGVFEIKATMFQIKSDTYIYNLAQPEKIEYEGNAGIAHNKKIRLKIFINSGADEDFEIFSDNGFSFIPYKNTLPIIGGCSIQSAYFKSIKRNLGILSDDQKTEIKYNSLTDKLNSEYALSKVDSSLNDYLTILNYYKQPVINEVDISDDYLNTLPFPKFFEEFNILSDNPSLTLADAEVWKNDYGRPDIEIRIIDMLSVGMFPPFSTDAEKPFSFPVETYFNPTKTQNDVWDGGIYNRFESELGNSIGDCDISNVKYYNKPKSIWEMFGFEEDDLKIIGKPDEPRYWRNIIPKDYSIFRRDGIPYVEDFNDEDIIIIDEDLPPNPISTNGFIDTYANQDWIDINQQLGFGHKYYYPVLPKHGADGKFINLLTNQDGNVVDGYSSMAVTLQPNELSDLIVWDNDDMEINTNNIPLQIVQIIGEGVAMAYNPVEQEWQGNFTTLVRGAEYRFKASTTFTWDVLLGDIKIPHPSTGAIINNEQGDDLLLQIENEKDGNNIFSDTSGNGNKGFVISDFKPKFDNETFKPKKTRFMNIMKTTKTNRAF